MKKLSILLFALVLSLSAFAGKEPEKSSGITFQALYPEPHHRRVSQVVSQLLMRQHYRQRAIDDSLSSEMFDRYLESLDPQKLYFLQEDIDAFEQYRYRFDDFVRSGQVEEAFSIFNVYQKRVAERLTYVYRRLEQPFDFSREEYLEFDREDAPWARTRQELDDLWRKRLKHQALNLKLAGKEWPDVVETLRKRYKRIERNISQTQSEDVFQLLMNALS
ncbi:MAG: tail-specific protease, partial [Calditrichaeota bacterium]